MFTAYLHPFRNCCFSMGKSKFLKDVVYTIRLYLLASPGLEPYGGLQVPGLALEYSPVGADRSGLLV